MITFLNMLQINRGHAAKSKSGSGSFSPDQHKANPLMKPALGFITEATYDLEGLAAAARQKVR
ncbi:MAG: hypothetical protein ACI4XS_09770 [Bacillus sp. (in: firmicutes)]